MKFSLLPPDEEFFRLFEEAGDNLVQEARLLRDLVEHYENPDEGARRILEASRQGDLLTRELVNRSNRFFFTPLAREDIQVLALTLEGVSNFIVAVADAMHVLKVSSPTLLMLKVTDLLTLEVEEIRKAVFFLRRPRSLFAFCREIETLETEAEGLYRRLLTELFEKEKDPLAVLKWQEIYSRMELALKGCSDVADTVQGIAEKNR
jgi:hypothetical protein